MRRGVSQDLMKLGVALLGIAAVGAWFFTTPEDEEGAGEFTEPAVTAILVDTSASSTRGRQGWKRWVIRSVRDAARRGKERGDELALVTFGAGVERRIGPIDAETFFTQLRTQQSTWFERAEADLETDMAGAAEVSAALLSEADRAPGTIVILGDGVPTGRDPSASLLANPDWTVRLQSPPAMNRVDMGVVRAIAPKEVAPNAAVPVELDCVLVGPSVEPGSLVLIDWRMQVTGTDTTTRGRSLEVHGASEGEFLSGTILEGTAEVPIPATACAAAAAGAAAHGDDPRPFRLRFTVPGAAAGSASFQAQVRRKDVMGDPFPENDSARTSWRIGDPVRVIVCAPEAALRAATEVFNGPAFDGMEFRGVTPTNLLSALTVEPERLPDAVVTVELPYVSLPGAALAAFVEERGGGWVHSAGWPMTRVEESRLTELAALEPDLTPKPPRDIVFFVDGSGSMEGERWRHMRRALQKLLPSVPANDTLSLRFFTRSMGEEEFRLVGQESVEAAVAERDQALKRLLRMRVPGGATDIIQSLFELARSRDDREHSLPADGQEAPENDGLVVLISDGETRSPASRRKSARAALAKRRDGLVAIHVGDGKGVRFLKGLLLKGEEVILATELDDLLDSLQQAIHELTLVEEARLVPSKLPQGADEPWREVLQDVQGRIVDSGSAAGAVSVVRALPARATDGSEAVAGLVSESLTLSGRTSTFAAAARRGRGLAAGLAAPIVVENADASPGTSDRPWAPEVAARPGWLAPLLRWAARQRDAADEALDGTRAEAEASAQWIVDARLAFGADTRRRGAWVLVEQIDADMPLVLEAEFHLGESVGGHGRRVAGQAWTGVATEFTTTARDPRTVRVVPIPEELRDLPAGTAVHMRLKALGEAGGAIAGPFRLLAPGPEETSAARLGAKAALFQVNRTVLAPRGLRGGPGSEVSLRAPTGGPGAEKRGHPIVPWLLALGLLALFSGAVLATRGR